MLSRYISNHTFYAILLQPVIMAVKDTNTLSEESKLHQNRYLLWSASLPYHKLASNLFHQ